MKNRLCLLVLLVTFCSCAKTITKTCKCEDPWGGISTQDENQTNSKKDSQAFVDECNKKSTTWHSTSGTGSNAVTTTTVVPCKIID